MDLPIIISLASLGISAAVAVASLIVFVRYDSRLKEQTKELNEKLSTIYDSQILQIENYKAKQNKADLLVKPLPYNGSGNYTIRISNRGNGKAVDIRTGNNTLTQDNGILYNQFKTIRCIDSLGCADFILTFGSSMRTNHSLVLIWNDDITEDNSKEFSFNL